MFRHYLKLSNPSLKCSTKTWDDMDEGPLPDDFPVILEHTLGHKARFNFAWTGGFLEIGADITEPEGFPYKPRQEYRHWYDRDHIVILLDPCMDHSTRRMLAVLRSGKIVTDDKWQLPGEERGDVQTLSLELPPLSPEVKIVERPDGWRMRVRIHGENLRRRSETAFPEAPIGLMLRFGVCSPVVNEAPSWPDIDSFWMTGPFGFGELAGPDAVLNVEELDFGKPVWKTGDRSSTLALRGSYAGKSVARGICEVAVTDTLGKTSSNEYEWAAAGGIFHFEVPVYYPFSSKWAPEIIDTARLAVTIRDSKGAVLWRASFPFGFDTGIIVREPYDMAAPKGWPPKRPSPENDNFVEAYRTWLLMKLPDYAWKTTRAGAPSDFYLESDPRGHDINLAAPDVFGRIADVIRSLFEDWNDALPAAAMLLHHPCFTVHSSCWAKVANNADTETILRLGGCFCGDCARIIARLAEESGKRYDVPLKGYTLGLDGHLIGLIDTPAGEVLLDPMLGLYFHTLDNTRLATLDEMRGDIRIQRRMWLNAFRHGHEFFHDVYNQVKAVWSDGPLEYPPGLE